MQTNRLRLEGISIAHVKSTERPAGDILKVPQSDGYSTITQLRDFERHGLWRNNRLIFDGSHARGALAISDLTDDWRCMHASAFENVRVNIPRSVLEDFAREQGRANFRSLSCEREHKDPVILSLAHALVPALEHQVETDLLFVDHVLLALQAHISARYGGIDLFTPRRHGLSPRQLNTATSFLAANSSRGVRIAEVAAECGLSLSYFIKAFKGSTGQTPHRWLVEYRTQRSLDMLLGDQSIADIAAACDFADQAHFLARF